jgi:hypothetical protein
LVCGVQQVAACPYVPDMLAHFVGQKQTDAPLSLHLLYLPIATCFAQTPLSWPNALPHALHALIVIFVIKDAMDPGSTVLVAKLRLTYL